MQSFKKQDKILVVSASLLAIILSYFLMDDTQLLKTEKNIALPEIGNIQKSKNDVRRRKSDSFTWIPANNKENVFENDSFFTGDKSFAFIVLKDGSKITLEPNSLITLKKQKGEMKLDLQYGNLTSEIKKGSILTVQSGDREIKISGEQNKKTATIRLKKTRQGNVNFKMVEGQAEITNNQKTTKIQKDESVSITQLGALKKPEPWVVQLLQPKYDSFEIFNKNEPIIFNWSLQSKAKKNLLYWLEISKNADFNSVIFKTKTHKTEHKVIGFSNSGRYYWRIRAIDQDESEVISLSQIFDIKINPPPQWVKPSSESIIEKELIGELKHSIEFQWTASSKGRLENKNHFYELQLATEPSFQNPILNKKTPDNIWSSPELNSGVYFARVKETFQNRSTEWSSVQKFTLQLSKAKIPPPPAPIVITPLVLFKPEPLSGRSPASLPKPILQWQSLIPAKKYRVQISKDKNFKTGQQFESASSTIEWSQYKPGRYFFRVFAYTEKNLWSLPSNPGEIQVQIDKPKVQPIAEIVVNDHTFKAVPPPQNLTVTWDEIPFAEKYKVKLTRMPQKNESILRPQTQTFVVSKNQIQVTLRKPSNYSVEVQPFDQRERALTESSAPEEFRYIFRALLESPQTVFPKNQYSFFMQKKSELNIKLRWNQVKNAVQYKVELSADSDFKKVLLSDITEESFYLIKDKIDSPQVYWRVKAKAEFENDDSDWSIFSAFNIFHQHNEVYQ